MCAEDKRGPSLFLHASAAVATTAPSNNNPKLSDVELKVLQVYFSAAQASASKGGRELKPFDEWV